MYRVDLFVWPDPVSVGPAVMLRQGAVHAGAGVRWVGFRSDVVVRVFLIGHRGRWQDKLVLFSDLEPVLTIVSNALHQGGQFVR